MPRGWHSQVTLKVLVWEQLWKEQREFLPGLHFTNRKSSTKPSPSRKIFSHSLEICGVLSQRLLPAQHKLGLIQGNPSLRAPGNPFLAKPRLKPREKPLHPEP